MAIGLLIAFGFYFKSNAKASKALVENDSLKRQSKIADSLVIVNKNDARYWEREYNNTPDNDSIQAVADSLNEVVMNKEAIADSLQSAIYIKDSLILGYKNSRHINTKFSKFRKLKGHPYADDKNLTYHYVKSDSIGVAAIITDLVPKGYKIRQHPK